MKNLFLLVLLVFIISCVSKKDIIYFQNDEIDQNKVSNDFVTIFKADDLLQITISSEDLTAVQPFNLPVTNFMSIGGRGQGVMQQQLYLIDSEGYIDFPVLGRLHLGGKTREKTIAMFKEKLDPDYVKNPTINIFIANFKITVSGAVNKPGTYTIPNERVTIIEALGLAGDLRISGLRKKIQVIREEDGLKKIYNVDLRSKSLFTSPVYYLQQNDVIYVEPNYASIQSASQNSNTSLFISITSLLITIVTLLTR
ncbi:MAG: sugar transporter [Flavobacteriaceae bacterium]|nr:sugar transporter [Flavobacteriaceae bacterium]|tara:strand:- start:2286 stop:3047 length:762 start_codon:yes stop_codon:yes gene_type:complete